MMGTPLPNPCIHDYNVNQFDQTIIIFDPATLILPLISVGNCHRVEQKETAEPVTSSAAPDGSRTLPVEGGPDKPLPRKFSKTHEANFSPGHEKPQGTEGVIFSHVAKANSSLSPRS